MLIPLMTEKLQAGFPSPAADHLETALSLDEYLIQNPPATFFVGVKGCSMEAVGIFEGDIAVVDRARIAKHEDIVVALKDNQFLIKTLLIQQETLYLKAHHPTFPVQTLNEDQGDRVWGVVTGLVRRMV